MPNPIPFPASPVPPLNDDLAGLLEDLTGFDVPGLSMIVEGFRHLNTSRMTILQAQAAATLLAGSTDPPGQQVDVQALLVATVCNLLDSNQTVALRALPTEVQDQARTVAHELADHDSYVTPRQHLAKTIYDLNPI